MGCNKTWKGLIFYYVWYRINNSDNFSLWSDKSYNYNLTVEAETLESKDALTTISVLQLIN